jgi:hypothetical protein
MSHNICCFRCGNSLAAMSLPISRQDECPECAVYLHVCLMCEHFDASVPRQCREDGADDVTEKDRVNFCDWFSPSESAFDPGQKAQVESAKHSLDALFSDTDAPDAGTDASDADSLFK